MVKLVLLRRVSLEDAIADLGSEELYLDHILQATILRRCSLASTAGD
ncbi:MULTISPECIES: hypothetical protein [Natrialbaceae]|nr:hypothetical protein [Natronococcus sp. CG52]